MKAKFLLFFNSLKLKLLLRKMDEINKKMENLLSETVDAYNEYIQLLEERLNLYYKLGIIKKEDVVKYSEAEAEKDIKKIKKKVDYIG